jgi:hypothetical protein
MQASERLELAQFLQDKTGMGRLTHVEIMSVLDLMETAYDITKKPVYEEQTFKMPELAEAVIEGDEHNG